PSSRTTLIYQIKIATVVLRQEPSDRNGLSHQAVAPRPSGWARRPAVPALCAAHDPTARSGPT
ncbi:hypothetical protein, partial [Acetobacter senegalensis]|uniref:hypothetical protein n=1 Tax=Acetobacter senegalensis TaxID=446692 RepID=UPI00265537D7